MTPLELFVIGAIIFCFAFVAYAVCVDGGRRIEHNRYLAERSSDWHQRQRVHRDGTHVTEVD